MMESRYAQHPRYRARLATPLAHACWLGVALALAVGAAQARPIEMNSVPWAPFYGPDLKGQGFITAVTQAAFEEAGHDAQIEFVPWARAMLETKQGDRDVLMGAYYSAERAETYAFSDVIYETKVGLVALRDLGVERFDSLRDLTDYTIGYGRGWATTEEFDNADYLDKEAAKNNVLNVRKLYEGRIDMIAMNFDRFNQIVREEGLDPERAVFLEPALKTSGLYLMVSEAIDDTEQLVADFNQGIAALRESGRYQEILQRYGLNTE